MTHWPHPGRLCSVCRGPYSRGWKDHRGHRISGSCFTRVRLFLHMCRYLHEPNLFFMEVVRDVALVSHMHSLLHRLNIGTMVLLLHNSLCLWHAGRCLGASLVQGCDGFHPPGPMLRGRDGVRPSPPPPPPCVPACMHGRMNAYGMFVFCLHSVVV